MQSKIEGRNYVVRFDGEKKPVKMNKAVTDKILEKLSAALGEIEKVLVSTANDNPDLHRLILMKLSNEKMNTIEGSIPKAIMDTKQNIDWEAISLQTRNDDIPSEEELMTLEDLGFVKHIGEDNLWEKVISNEKDKEVIEEILVAWLPERRLKTVYWDTNEPKKKYTKKVEYKKVPISKKFSKVIENTMAMKESQKREGK